MEMVIRLQGLSATAGSEDIRNFFTGLKIPDGGVHIIGGLLEEAYIIFASDDDARRAMTRSGGCIRGSPVNLMLSSKAEMQHVFEASAKRTEMSRNRVYNEGFSRAETNMAPPTFAENFLNEVRRTDHLDGITGPAVREDMRVHQTRMTLPSGNDGFYLYLQGMPFSVSREDVRAFFKGLLVDDIILMKNHRGQNNGIGMVRFGTLRDACEGLKRDREYIGTRFVEINTCSEKQWIEAGGSVGPFTGNTAEFPRESPPSYVEKRYPRQRTRSVSPVRYRSRSSSPSGNEYGVLMKNVSYLVDKRSIKRFFHPVELKEDQILLLHDDYRKRTGAAFVLFSSLKDYYAGLTRHKEVLADRPINVTPISKEKMVAMLDSLEQKMMERSREKPSTSLDRPQHSQRPKYELERVCVYVRNLPFDVSKFEIMDFFRGFRLSEDMVHQLHDEKGSGLGEALVTFHSEEEAQRAESLHGQRFRGSEVMLKSISRMQMQVFGVTEHPRKSPELPLRMRSPERYSTRHREASDFPLDEEFPDFGIPSNVHMPRNSPVHSNGSSSRFDSRKDGRDTFVDREGRSAQRELGNQFDGPACLKLINLPLNITIDEIYDFCYGYRVVPGSVSLLYNQSGAPKGSATVVFESRQEAETAVQELRGRPIGTKKIKLFLL